MAPLNPLSVKIDDDLQADLLTIATKRQEETGERITVSDVIRDLLQQGASKELSDRPQAIDVVELCEEYRPIGRTLMKTISGEDLRKDPIRLANSTRSFVIEKRGCVPSQVFVDCDDEEFEIPPFEIACYPEWPMRRGTEPEQEFVRSSMATISRMEDSEIIACISASVPTGNTVIHADDTHEGTMSKHLSIAASHLWSRELTVHGIVYNPIHTDAIGAWVEEQRGRQWPRNDVDYVVHRPSTMCDPSTILLVGDPTILGRIVVYVEQTVVQADDPKRLMHGRVVWESIGVAVINGHAASKVFIV